MENIAYKNITKKLTSNKPLEKDSDSNNNNQKINNFRDLLFLIPETGRKLTLLGIDLAIKLPIQVAGKAFSIAKYAFFEIPINLAYNTTHTVIISPVKWIINKLNPFSN
jgi:hypothetical protein